MDLLLCFRWAQFGAIALGMGVALFLILTHQHQRVGPPPCKPSLETRLMADGRVHQYWVNCP